MRDYRLVSADGHVNEPPTIWSERIPARYRDRAPRMEHLELGDAWTFEGWDGPVNFGFNAAAGMPAEQRRPWIRWEEVPARSYEPNARVAALDEGGVDAELLYATPRVAAGLMASTGDADFHLACVRAYNDWLSELCSAQPDRLFGLALMPALGARAAVDELHRALSLPGISGPYIARWPSGEPGVAPQDDPFWAAVTEADVPVSVHVAVATGARSGDSDPNRARLGARGEFRGLGGETAVNCLDLISGGVFDRFPALRIVFAECESSWVPCAKQTFDDRYRRYPRADVAHPPSHYFDHNIFTTFVLDRYAVVNRHEIGVSQMLWSNDLFHAVCEWPHDWAVIDDHFAGVPAEATHRILAGNAVDLYHLG
jgi:predicted TIM-barrel fold metal-dependent hydrolase